MCQEVSHEMSQVSPLPPPQPPYHPQGGLIGTYIYRFCTPKGHTAQMPNPLAPLRDPEAAENWLEGLELAKLE